MARKIKSKKHRGIKDPLSHYNQSIEKIKDKINKPPKNSDVQEVPKKFQAVNLAAKKIKKEDKRRKKRQQLLLDAKKNKKKIQNALKRKNKGKDANDIEDEEELINTADFVDKKVGWYPTHGRPFNPIPTIQQQKGEPNYIFRKRLKAVTDAVLYEAKYRKKFDVDIQRNEFGEVTQVVKRSGEKAREKRRLREKERKLKLKMKKQKINPQEGNDDILIDDIDEREKQLFRKDNVAFGEVTHRPPQLETSKLDKMLKNQKVDSKNYVFIQNLKKSSNQNLKADTSKTKISKKDLEEERQAAVSSYRRQKALVLNTMNSLT